MPKHLRGIGTVADSAISQWARMSLQLDELDPVALFAARRDCVRAVVASRTVYSAMTARSLVQRPIRGIGAAVAGRSAAGRFVEPTTLVGCDVGHVAVAGRAVRCKILRHRVPQALCRRARVAVVAPLGGIRLDVRNEARVVVAVHHVGEAPAKGDALGPKGI